jgi:hypothetical protein
MAVTSTLAYYNMATIMVKRSFIVVAELSNVSNYGINTKQQTPKI